MTPVAAPFLVDDPAACVDRRAVESAWAAQVEENPRFAAFAPGVLVVGRPDEELWFTVQIRCAPDGEWCARTWDAEFLSLPAQPITPADCPAVADAVITKVTEQLQQLVVSLCDAHPLACGAGQGALIGPWTVAVGASGGPTLRALALGVDASRDLAVGRVHPTFGARLNVGAPVRLDVNVPGCFVPDAAPCDRPGRSAPWASVAATVGAALEAGPAWGAADLSGGVLVAGGSGFPEGSFGAAPICALRVSGGLVGDVGPFIGVEAGLFPSLVAEYADPVPLPAVRLGVGLRAALR